MPPIQGSLRGSLLTGASALALSVTGYSAQAQVTQPFNPQSPWTVWVEGALFHTGGNGVTLPVVGPNVPGGSFLTLGPNGGWEFAAGFDYAGPGPWHAVFDIRYGRSRTSTAHFFNQGRFSSPGKPSFTTVFNNSVTAWEHETHLVTDFMIGRDVGLGSTTGQIQFGMRIADLSAIAHVSGQYHSSYFISRAFQSSTTTSGQGTWKSRFVGGGPRVAFTDSVPLVGLWSFDYMAGVAALLGSRTADYQLTYSNGNAPYLWNNGATVVVFNADGWGALSYAFSPGYKLSLGIRGDYYNHVLESFDPSTGQLTSLDRLYWGPFLRLTGKF